jgi:hypothetical protein
MAHRVICWSTGNVGAHAVRAVVERPDLELVGLYVHSESKAGRDAGELVGIDPLGVTATSSIDELVATDADVVIHAPLPSLVHGDDPDADLATICRLLASGKDVITVVGYMYPSVHGAEVVDRLTEACEAGQATFHGTGLNPGWMGEILPLTMSALSKRIDAITVTEISDFARYPSPEIMFSMMGFGSHPDEFERTSRRRAHWLNGLFRENITLMAHGLGVELDRVDDQLELDLATETYDVAAGTIEAGSVAGQRWVWTGVLDGRVVLTHETVWRMGPAAGTAWPTGDHSIVIAGEPAMELRFGGRWLSDGLLATAMHAVNAVDVVGAASPGIKTFLDLPPIFGKGALR